MNKHYIRVDGNGLVTKAFSNAFEQPLQSDIFIKDGGRHYHLQIFRDDGKNKWEYKNGKLEMTLPNPRIGEIERDLQDIQAWFMESDWKAHKIALGEWERTDSRSIAYLEERALKRELQDSLTNELNLLEV